MQVPLVVFLSFGFNAAKSYRARRQLKQIEDAIHIEQQHKASTVVPLAHGTVATKQPMKKAMSLPPITPPPHTRVGFTDSSPTP